MKVLITGAAGFIGSALALRLLERGDAVIGIDNHNDYYDPALKEARLARHAQHPNYVHLRIDIADRQAMEAAFVEHKPNRVVNLAAQAGVRYSLENPLAYIDSNLVGFGHILEGCRHHGVEHLVYASSSSVYGANTTMPFSVHHNVDHPLSLYAATKKANELMAHTYSHLYGLPTTGLRFFTVYGPWGRPDMALFKFTKAILAGEKIPVFNYGRHRRDFTYIDDIVEGVIRVLDQPARPNPDWSGDHPDPGSSRAPSLTQRRRLIAPARSSRVLPACGNRRRRPSGCCCSRWSRTAARARSTWRCASAKARPVAGPAVAVVSDIGRSAPHAHVQRNHPRAQVVPLHAHEAGLLHHRLQRGLVRMLADGLGQVAVAVGIVRDQPAQPRQHLE